MRPFLSALVLGAVVLGGCAGSGRLEEEMSRMRRDLHELKKEVSQSRLDLERLEGRVTLLALGRGQQPAPAPQTPVAGAPQPARAQERSAGPERALPVVRLGANAADARAQDDDNWIEPGALDDGSPPIMIKLGPSSEGDRLPVDHEVLKKPDPNLARSKPSSPRAEAPQTARDSYEAALALLRDERKPVEALAALEAFLDDHPSSKFADNALYWSGECLAELGRHQEAVQKLERLFRQFSKSSKIPHAMLRQGESWIALGQTSRGRASLERLIDTYPAHDAAKRARARLDELAAKGER